MIYSTTRINLGNIFPSTLRGEASLEGFTEEESLEGFTEEASHEGFTEEASLEGFTEEEWYSLLSHL